MKKSTILTVLLFYCLLICANAISFVPVFNSVQTFGARGDGKTDDTVAIQNALNAGGFVVLPKGKYRISSTLFIRSDNTVLMGHGPSATVLEYEGLGSVIKNELATRTLYWCRLIGMRIEAKNQNQVGAIVNWNSMQFGNLEDVWIMGNGHAKTIGLSLSAISQLTEATYNRIAHSYIGLVDVGINFGYGANSNTVENSRILPKLGGVGIYMEGSMSNNRILNNGFEMPKNVSGGILIKGDVHNTLIQGNRFEGLSYGWKIHDNAVTDTVAIGNYYDSIPHEANWIDQGLRTKNFDRAAMVQIGEWHTWIPAGNFARHASALGRWRDVWEDKHLRQYQVKMIFSEEPKDADSRIELPEGHEIDTSALLSSTPLVQIVGYGTGKIATGIFPVTIHYESNKTVAMMYQPDNSIFLSALHEKLQGHWQNAEIVVDFKVPESVSST